MEPRGRTCTLRCTLADSGRSYPRSQVRLGFCMALERTHLDHYPRHPQTVTMDAWGALKDAIRIYKLTGKGI